MRKKVALQKGWSLQIATALLVMFPAFGCAHPGNDQVLAYLNTKLESGHTNQAFYIRRGRVYSEDGQFGPALEDLNRAEQLGNPTKVAFELGILFYRKGEFVKARTYFDTVLYAAPGNVAALEYRARLLHDAGEYDDAIKDLANYLTLVDRPNPGHYILMARMLSEPRLTRLATSPASDLGPALAALDQGIAQLGPTPQLQQYAIKLELEQNRLTQALARLESLESTLGNSPQWKVQLGELLLVLGETDRARTHLEAAILQLRTLKKTPARQHLQTQASALLEAS